MDGKASTNLFKRGPETRLRQGYCAKYLKILLLLYVHSIPRFVSFLPFLLLFFHFSGKWEPGSWSVSLIPGNKSSLVIGQPILVPCSEQIFQTVNLCVVSFVENMGPAEIYRSFFVLD